MERGLVLRQHFFGADSDEVWRACKTVGEMCNLLAMTYLQQEDFAMVLELLKKAEILTERDKAQLLSTTWRATIVGKANFTQLYNIYKKH